MNTTGTNSLFHDTICAPATPVGGALAIIRLSGRDAVAITDSVFSGSLAEAKTATLHYGVISDDDGSVIDDVVVSVYRAPHSYTGEDATELSCHGSAYVVNALLRLLVAHGARMAEPGEYTRRAYLNGKMDLSQAEAVADLIASSTKAQHDIAVNQLRGGVSNRLSAMRDRLLKLNALLELELDFSDHEELEFADRSELLRLAKEIDGETTALAASFRQGNAIKEGVPVAIVGKTNVGKSTLLNRLVGEQRAIVSDVHGTTRDTIDDTLVVRGTLFRLTDTAGLRHTTDRIEQIGIDRSLEAIRKATVVLWVIDEKPSAEEVDDMAERCRGKKLIVVVNKTDLKTATEASEGNAKAQNSNDGPVQLPSDSPVVRISAKQGTGIDDLLDKIYDVSEAADVQKASVVIANQRHYALLRSAHDHLSAVIAGIEAGLSGDLLAEDLKLVLSDLATITGRGIITPQETLNTIFQHFWIGK